ncbi:acetyl-CoA C-acyltransferase [candidate division KSB1 bacterium]|nr:MAG: acetyl-CoA C-acyltransferase [candidate division KSB1 bacterium]
MSDVVIVDGLRSPFVKYNTDFKDLPPEELSAILVRELLRRNHLKSKDIDEVIIGNVAQPPQAANIARHIALRAGLDVSVPAYTVQRNCASGMEAVAQAAMKIRSLEGSVFIVGGVESMSRIPFLFNWQAQNWFTDMMRARSLFSKVGTFFRFRPSFFKPVSGLQLGLTDGYTGLNMGQSTEILVKEFGISREEQDAFALESHLKAARAQKEGRFAEEIFPITLPGDPSNVISKDNGIRPDQSIEALARLKPVFVKEGGTLTAGNSSQITDGAVMMLVMSEAKAREYGFEILTRVKMFSFAGVDPKRMGLGPAFALSKMMRKIGISFKEVGLFEINEAFAAQVIANLRIMESDSLSNKYLGISHKLGEIPADLLNVNGGAIALGHPVGASGARLILTLGLEMKRRNVLMGLASLCIGGGQGAAFLLQNY